MENRVQFTKKLFIVSVFALISVFCRDVASEPSDGADPFAEGKSPSSLVNVAWERLIVAPLRYQGKPVSISGWLVVERGFVIKLFKDEESMKKRKSLTFVMIHPSSNLIRAYKSGKEEEWLELSGRFVSINCFVRGIPIEVSEGTGIDCVGVLIGPFEISFVNSMDGTEASIYLKSLNADWRKEELPRETESCWNFLHAKLKDKQQVAPADRPRGNK